MKKIISLLIVLALSIACLSACGETTKDTVAPTITGVVDSTSIQLTESFNALDGVTASDDVDGDITSSIVITSEPQLTFTNGVATPSAMGAYEITYSVADKAGNTTEAYCTLTVTRKTATEEDFHTFSFTDYDTADVDTFFTMINYNDSVSTLAKEDGILKLNVTNLGNSEASSNSVTLAKNLNTEVGVQYKINIYMKSSDPVWFNMIANHTASGWLPLGTSGWNFAIPGTDVYTCYTVTFDAPAAAPEEYSGEAGTYDDVYFFLEVGKYNVDGIGTNPVDGYEIDILKVELYEIVGTEYDVSAKKTESFSAENADMLLVSPAEGTTTYEEGKAVYNVTKFVDDAAGWEIHLRANLGVAFQKDTKYKIKYTLDVDAPITAGGGICVEDIDQEWQCRAHFEVSPEYQVGAYEYEFTFTSLADVAADKAIITWYLKDAPTGQTTSCIKLSSIEVFEVKGNKSSDKTTYHFYPFNGTTTWTCWNDTDDDLGQNGLGTMYYKDGAMVFDVETVSGADYGNKIFNNALTFTEGGLYKIEFTIRASADCTTWFILNPPNSYDPIISQTFDLTTTSTKFTVQTTSEFVVDKDLQLIFSFGSDYNTAGPIEGGLQIYFESIKVIKLN